MKIKPWIEAMRLRTLPVSAAGVIAAAGCAAHYGSFKPLPWTICLIFAVMAQIVSNFANEYFDFRNGLDRKGRDGFRRGVTEGDITPAAMRNATFGLLAATCAVGCSLIFWGGWWLVFVGIAIALFAIAYSAGPYPLSHHGLGDIAVVIFFGIVPVIMTTYIQTGSWEMIPVTLPVSVAVGLMGANVLIVNNYRDMDDDRAVGKRTLAVVIGRRGMSSLYLANGFMAVILTLPEWVAAARMGWLCPCVYLILHVALYTRLVRSRGEALNPLLGMTSCLMMLYAVMFTLVVCMV